VRTLVELHGGNTSATSEGPGKGSEFRVTLPRAGYGPLKLTDEVAESPVRASNPALRLSVLVVDDNVDARELLAEARNARSCRASCGRW
jgi:hypothetical protein